MPDLDDLEMDLDVEEDDGSDVIDNLNLDMLQDKSEKAKFDELNLGLPSQREARLNAIRTSKRVQMNFSGIPEPIMQMFQQRAKKLKISKIQLFYNCLKTNGFEIPDNLDKRKMI